MVGAIGSLLIWVLLIMEMISLGIVIGYYGKPKTGDYGMANVIICVFLLLCYAIMIWGW